MHAPDCPHRLLVTARIIFGSSVHRQRQRARLDECSGGAGHRNGVVTRRDPGMAAPTSAPPPPLPPLRYAIRTLLQWGLQASHHRCYSMNANRPCPIRPVETADAGTSVYTTGPPHRNQSKEWRTISRLTSATRNMLNVPLWSLECRRGSTGSPDLFWTARSGPTANVGAKEVG